MKTLESTGKRGYNKCFTCEIFFVLVKSFSILPVRLQRIVKKALFLRFSKVSVEDLFDNLESGKRNYCFGKSLEKVLNCGSKNRYEPCISPGLKSRSLRYPVVFSLLVSDSAVNEAAKIIRLLHVTDLRELQTRINEAIVAVQAITANPKTNQSLGRVGV